MPTAKALGGGQRQQPRRRNWLGQIQRAGGALQRAFFTGPHAGENWEVIGATLQDLGGDGRTSYYDDLMANRENQRRYNQQQTWRAQEQKHQVMGWQREAEERARAEAERAARAAALNNVPEELRPYALLGIEGPITQYFRNRYPTPSRARAPTGAPDLPGGFVWED